MSRLRALVDRALCRVFDSHPWVVVPFDDPALGDEAWLCRVCGAVRWVRRA